MRTEHWTIEKAAEEFEIPLEAAYEAVDYGERYGHLIEAEDAEDARAAKSVARAITAG